MKILEKIAKISSFDEGQYKKWEEIQEERNIKKNRRNIDEYRLINKTVKKSLDFTFYCQFSNEISVKNHQFFWQKAQRHCAMFPVSLCSTETMAPVINNIHRRWELHKPPWWIAKFIYGQHFLFGSRETKMALENEAIRRCLMYVAYFL